MGGMKKKGEVPKSMREQTVLVLFSTKDSFLSREEFCYKETSSLVCK